MAEDGERRGDAAMARVSIRPQEDADALAVESWLAEALVTIWGNEPPESLPVTLAELRTQCLEHDMLVIVRMPENRPVGFIVYRSGSAFTAIELFAIRAGERNFGLGMDAVCALERSLAGRLVLAGIPLANGLAVYFWLRAGYRPLYPQPVPAALPSGRLWMVRGSG